MGYGGSNPSLRTTSLRVGRSRSEWTASLILRIWRAESYFFSRKNRRAEVEKICERRRTNYSWPNLSLTHQIKSHSEGILSVRRKKLQWRLCERFECRSAIARDKVAGFFIQVIVTNFLYYFKGDWKNFSKHERSSFVASERKKTFKNLSVMDEVLI